MPFTTNVQTAIPDIWNNIISLHLGGNDSSLATINANAIPIEPLNPPYVNTSIYDHDKPYPNLLSHG